MERLNDTSKPHPPVPVAWVTDDGDVVVLHTHDPHTARTAAYAEHVEPFDVANEPGLGWIITGHDNEGEWYQHVPPGTPDAIPACTW